MGALDGRHEAGGTGYAGPTRYRHVQNRPRYPLSNVEGGSMDQGFEGQGSGVNAEYVRLALVRLYQTDADLAERIPNGAGELTPYIKTLTWVATEFFGRLDSEHGSLGVLIVVGIKPSKRTKLWCELVGGSFPPDVWEVFVDLVQGAGENVRPTVTKPVAFAMEFVLGAGPSDGFPLGPLEWQQTAAQHHGPLSVPDALFEAVFPD
jgi:hypothetical protein